LIRHDDIGFFPPFASRSGLMNEKDQQISRAQEASFLHLDTVREE
jgi:hypothetical protein